MERIRMPFRWLMAAGLVLGAGLLSACSPAAASGSAYKPQERDFTISIVPLAVHEQQAQMGFLKDDFAKGGLLDGKEIYGASPSSITVYQGDTVKIDFVNPADDPHPIALTDFGKTADLKGKSTTTLTFVASKVGVFKWACTLPEHAPYMWGEVVVLPQRDAS